MVHFTVMPQQTEPTTLSSALKSIASGEFQTFSAPTSASSFNCYVVNVAGPGVPLSTPPTDCIFNASYSGPAFGIRSEPVPAGTSVTLQVPEGSNRQVSVFGIYPAVSECGGSNSGPPQLTSGYLLGNTTVELKDNITVTVPVSFAAGTSAAFTCQDEVILAPTIGTYNSACADNVPSSPTPIAGTGAGGYPLANLSAAMAQEDTNFAVAECYASGPDQKVYSEFQFDVSAYNISDYEQLRIYWRGQAGEYTGTCSGSNATTAGGAVYLYNPSTTSWDMISGTLSATGSSTEAVSGTRSNIGQYVLSGSHIIVRVASVQSPSSGYCTRVATDYIRLVLRKPHSS